MTLDTLTTPFERRRILEYGVDGSKVVRHWYNVQRVSDTLYKGENTVNKYKEIECALYIIFPEADNGLLYQTLCHPAWYPVERMLEAVKRDCLDSAEHMIAELDRRMEVQQFIGNAQIEFVRQFNPERAECYAQYRKDYYARKAAEEHEKAAVRQVETAAAEAAKAAEKQAELMENKARYLGWADAMPPFRFGRVSSVMDKRIRVDGKPLTKRDFVISKFEEGWLPKKEEGVTSWYGSKWDPKESKPKTVYMLCKENTGYIITKTEYDFAVYLLERHALQGKGGEQA